MHANRYKCGGGGRREMRPWMSLPILYLARPWMSLPILARPWMSLLILLAQPVVADWDRDAETPWFDEVVGSLVVTKPTAFGADAASMMASALGQTEPTDDGGDVLDAAVNATKLTDIVADEWNRTLTITFEAKHGKLYANRQLFSLKGVNWFGSESRVGPPGGLNAHDIDYYLEFLARHGFNALRLLFNHESFLADAPLEQTELQRAPSLRGKSYRSMFQVLARAAAKYGILVMMACHRIRPAAWPGLGLWYDPSGPITLDRVLVSWDAVAAALCGEWNVFAVDLQNEPHAASWGFGRETDWDVAASRIGTHVLSLCPRWLVMVEGVGYTPGAPGADDPNQGFWWGGNLVGAKVSPVTLAYPSFGVTRDRLVYSPHTYGPGVYNQKYFDARDFPRNLEAVYEEQWAFVASETGAPIVIGEMGGFYTAKDKTWQDWALAYCKRKGIGIFYVCSAHSAPRAHDLPCPLRPSFCSCAHSAHESRLRALGVCGTVCVEPDFRGHGRAASDGLDDSQKAKLKAMPPLDGDW